MVYQSFFLFTLINGEGKNLKELSKSQQKRLHRKQLKKERNNLKNLKIVCAFYIRYKDKVRGIKLDCYKSKENAWKDIKNKFKDCEYICYMFIGYNKSKHCNYTLKLYNFDKE